MGALGGELTCGPASLPRPAAAAPPRPGDATASRRLTAPPSSLPARLPCPALPRPFPPPAPPATHHRAGLGGDGPQLLRDGAAGREKGNVHVLEAGGDSNSDSSSNSNRAEGGGAGRRREEGSVSAGLRCRLPRSAGRHAAQGGVRRAAMGGDRVAGLGGQTAPIFQCFASGLGSLSCCCCGLISVITPRRLLACQHPKIAPCG
jgi:hypothetical protein